MGNHMGLGNHGGLPLLILVFPGWKLELIEKKNPGWKDLYADITHQASMRKELLSSMIVCSKNCS